MSHRKDPSRRTFTKLSLLGTAAFSLAPARAFARKEPLGAAISAQYKDNALLIDLGAQNTGSDPLQVITAFGGQLKGRYGGGRQVQLRVVLHANDEQRELEITPAHYNDLHPPSLQERRSRAVRPRWSLIQPDTTLTLARLTLPWPDGIAAAGATVSIEAYVPTQDGYARLGAENLPIATARDES